MIVQRHRYKYSREGHKTRDDVRQHTAIVDTVKLIVPNKSQSGEIGWGLGIYGLDIGPNMSQ